MIAFGDLLTLDVQQEHMLRFRCTNTFRRTDNYNGTIFKEKFPLK